MIKGTNQLLKITNQLLINYLKDGEIILDCLDGPNPIKAVYCHPAYLNCMQNTL